MKLRWICAALATFCFVVLAGCGPGSTGLTITGSSTMAPLIAEAALLFEKQAGKQVEIQSGGSGRALAETAVLLFTAGYVLRMPGSLLDSGRALSVPIYDLAMHVPGRQGRAAASTLVLFCLILLINLAVHRLLKTGKEG